MKPDAKIRKKGALTWRLLRLLPLLRILPFGLKEVGQRARDNHEIVTKSHTMQGPFHP
jgi:hypothetical protein